MVSPAQSSTTLQKSPTFLASIKRDAKEMGFHDLLDHLAELHLGRHHPKGSQGSKEESSIVLRQLGEKFGLKLVESKDGIQSLAPLADGASRGSYPDGKDKREILPVEQSC